MTAKPRPNESLARSQFRPGKERDPEALGRELPGLAAGLGPGRPAAARPVVALDLATACGYAIAWPRPGEPFDPRRDPAVLGQLDLSAGPFDSGGLRFVRLRQFLAVIGPALILFEDTKYTPPESLRRASAAAIVARAATALEWFGGLKATLAAWAEERGVPCAGVAIGTIKRRAAGKGNASKAEVIRGVNALYGVVLNPEGYESSGHDNIADAAACLLVGLEQYALGVDLAPPRAERGLTDHQAHPEK